jgi:hypothetical protein
MDISNKKLYWRGKAQAVFGMIKMLATTRPITRDDIKVEVN